MKDDAVLLVQGADEIAHRRAQHALHRPLLQADDMDLDVPRAQRRRGLEPDKARADHDGAACAVRGRNDRAAVGQRTQHMDMGLVRARDRQAHRLGAGRQQEAVVGYCFAAGEHHGLRPGIDRGDLAIEPQVDARVGVETVRPQRQPVFRRAAGEIVLRQVRPVHRRGRFAAQHHDAAAKLLPPQHFGGGKPRRAAADDHDPAGRLDNPLHARLRLLAFLPDDNALALVLDLPHRDRAQRRRPGGFPGAQVETGMVPGAADAFAVHQAVGKRTVIMAAMGVDGENLRSRTHQQDFIVADMAKQGRAGEVGRRDTQRQIGAGW